MLACETYTFYVCGKLDFPFLHTSSHVIYRFLAVTVSSLNVLVLWGSSFKSWNKSGRVIKYGDWSSLVSGLCCPLNFTCISDTDFIMSQHSDSWTYLLILWVSLIDAIVILTSLYYSFDNFKYISIILWTMVFHGWIWNLFPSFLYSFIFLTDDVGPRVWPWFILHIRGPWISQRKIRGIWRKGQVKTAVWKIWKRKPEEWRQKCCCTSSHFCFSCGQRPKV